MLSINGKKFMNLPEAVQWLLNNNALPFQCKSNYVADTVIAKSDIINPSPAEIKVGSLVLFADSKVGTVSGITDSGFMVGQDYTDIGSQLNQIVSIDIDASQHLVFTMANGDTIDAGLIKELSGLSIDASQHLIAVYNDGSTADLGAIFQGNVNISGNLTADSIIENMTGYSYAIEATSNITKEVIYAGSVKNGNKITFVVFAKVTKTDVAAPGYASLGSFYIPDSVGNKLYPYSPGGIDYVLDSRLSAYFSTDVASVDGKVATYKRSSTRIEMFCYGIANLVVNTPYYIRYEVTFLLSDNLAA